MASQIYNANRGKGAKALKAEDFFPDPNAQPRRASREEMRSKIAHLNQFLAGLKKS